jgi:hypothetical protein
MKKFFNKNNFIINGRIIKKFCMKLDHSSDNQVIKCKMIYKKYISHDTFIASYEEENNKPIKVATGMHISVM